MSLDEGFRPFPITGANLFALLEDLYRVSRQNAAARPQHPIKLDATELMRYRSD